MISTSNRSQVDVTLDLSEVVLEQQATIERLTAELAEKEAEIQRLWKLRLETLPT
jgi:hypothetical protein